MNEERTNERLEGQQNSTSLEIIMEGHNVRMTAGDALEHGDLVANLGGQSPL